MRANQIYTIEMKEPRHFDHERPHSHPRRHDDKFPMVDFPEPNYFVNCKRTNYSVGAKLPLPIFV